MASILCRPHQWLCLEHLAFTQNCLIWFVLLGYVFWVFEYCSVIWYEVKDDDRCAGIATNGGAQMTPRWIGGGASSGGREGASDAWDVGAVLGASDGAQGGNMEVNECISWPVTIARQDFGIRVEKSKILESPNLSRGFPDSQTKMFSQTKLI